MTLSTLKNMGDDEALRVRNIHGQEYLIKKSFLEGVLTFAWIFQVLAIGVNLGGYLIHPMAVKMPGSEHTFQHVLGTRRDWAVGLSNVLNLLFRIGLYYPLYVLYYAFNELISM